MRVHLGVVTRGRAVPDLDRRIEQAAGRALPFAAGAPRAWTSPDGRIRLLAWSNEPDQPQRPLLTPEPDAGGATGFSGYLNGEAPKAHDLVAGRPLPRLGGVWSLFAATVAGVSGTTSAAGPETVFLAESGDVIVVACRALLAHLVADPSGPHPDPIGLTSVLSVGYAVTDRTAFAGVRALPPAHHALVDDAGRLRVVEARSSVEPLPVAEALRASVEPLRARGERVQLGLTGGRDSRLMVALLTASGVPVDTRTSGLPDDPDVVVASRVATALGVPHHVRPPRGAAIEGAEVTVDVLGRLKEAVVLSDAGLSAYDRVGRIDDAYDARRTPLGGSGGEILRAYYAGAVKDQRDPDAIETYMRGRVLGSVRSLTSMARAAYEDDVAPWLAAVRRDGAAALEELYLRQRTGRWTGAARNAASIGSLAQRPYLDHEVVRAARAVDLRRRIDERLVAELLDDLAPGLRDLPFAGRRWRFDEAPPGDAADRSAWEARAPITGGQGDQATFNWRLDLPEVRAELSSVILDAPDALWEIVQRKRIEEMLSPERPLRRQELMRTWHVATIAAALSNDFWAEPSARLTSAARPLVGALPAPSAGTAAVAAPGRARRIARRLRSRLTR